MILENKELDRKYEILKLLNKGGTANVYLAQDRSLKRLWVIKRIEKSFGLQEVNSMISEANIMKDLDHPMLPRIVEMTEDDRYHYIVMDYVQGEDLKTVLKVRGPIDQKLVMSWSLKVLSALKYLHEKGIVYRDVKPHNIMLTPQGEIMLVDFGIAREFKDGAGSDTQHLGTEGYAAPEQYEGHGQSDQRTDIYGMGVTMFQLLTDINPVTFKGNRFSVREQNPAISAGLDAIILKCTNRNPDKRFQSVDELASAIRNYEKYDAKYIKKKRKTIRTLYVLLSIAVSCYILSAVTGFIHYSNTENRYDALLSGIPVKENIEEAISLKPGSGEAYIALLEYYGDELSKDEISEFSSFFGNGKRSMKEQTKLDVSMAAGEKILARYDEESERSKLLTAYQYFSEVVNSGNTDYPKYDAARLYVGMADYYKNYIMQENSAIVNEGSKEVFEELLDEMASALGILENYEGTENKNLKLSAASLMTGLIYGECDLMAEQGIDKSRVSAVLDDLEKMVSEEDPHVEVTKKKKESVLSQIELTKEKVEATYSIHSKSKGE